MTAIGTTQTVTYEESKRLRKQGWKARNDVVVMMFVGQPEGVQSNISKATSNARNKKRTDERWAESYKARLAK